MHFSQKHFRLYSYVLSNTDITFYSKPFENRKRHRGGRVKKIIKNFILFEKNFAKNLCETGPIEMDVSILRRAQLLLIHLRFRQCKSVLLMQSLI